MEDIAQIELQSFFEELRNQYPNGTEILSDVGWQRGPLNFYLFPYFLDLARELEILSGFRTLVGFQRIIYQCSQSNRQLVFGDCLDYAVRLPPQRERIF